MAPPCRAAHYSVTDEDTSDIIPGSPPPCHNPLVAVTWSEGTGLDAPHSCADVHDNASASRRG
jgi:hypothetical protein